MRFALCLFAFAACAPTKTAQRQPDEDTGCASDEHWVTFDDQEPFAIVDDTQAPAPITVTMPVASTALISWQRSIGDVGMPAGDVPHDGPSCNMCCPQWNTGSLATLHLPPVSGDIFDLQFRLDAQTDMSYRVLTTLQEWQSPPGLVDSWRGHTVALKIYRMGLLLNDLKSGPFVASMPTTFSVP